MTARGKLIARSDRGATMLELVVGMSVMMIFLGIFTGTMMMMSRSESKARATTDTANQVSQAFLWFDKNVRYAAAISQPGQGTVTTHDWYVELRNTGTGTDVCTQIRIDTDQLQWRTWQPANTSTTLTGWTQIANGFTNGSAPAGATQPFSVPAPTGSQNHQRMHIILSASGGPANNVSTASSTFTFTAVNSSVPVPTAPICQEVPRP
jgi:type II secretory pathway pseudopilin PulG